MAESAVERRFRALEKQGQKSVKSLRLCLLAEAAMFIVLIAYYFVWTADLKTTSETIRVAMSKRFYNLEEIAEKNINEKAVQRQEIAEIESKMKALQQDFDHLQDSIRLNEITNTEEEAKSKTQVMVLQQNFNQFKETERVLEREFEKTKQQLKQTKDEASTAIAALKQELIDLLRDKQSKTAFQLESTLMKQQMDRLKQNEEALKREVELLRNKPVSNYSLQEVTELLQQQIESEQVLEREFEKIKQQLKQTQDEASMAIAALRQELVDLLRDKQSKTAFQLESTLIKQEMDRLKQNEEAMKQEIELLKNKTARNCSLQVVKDLLQQEFGQLKESEQVLEREFEKLKQQLKQTQDEASMATAALRQELIHLLRDKQSKTAFQLESTLMKQEMDYLKQNEEAMKREIENKLANITPTCTTLKQETSDLLQATMAEIVQLRQEIVQLLKQMRDAYNEESESVGALGVAMKEQAVNFTLLSEKQEAAREHLAGDVAELWDKQKLVWTAQLEIDQNEQLLKRELERMNRSHKFEAVSRVQDMKELRHKIQVLRKEATDSQAKFAKLANCCLQTSSATEASTSKEKVEGHIKLAQQGLSTGSVWRLLVVLWMIFYLFIYHQKFRNEIQGKINKLTEKQKTDREYYAQRVRVDKLKEKQESDRKQLVQVIYALVQVIYAALVQVIYKQRQRIAEKEEVAQLAKKLEAELAALKNRQEQIDILNDHYVPAFLPFHITVPLYILYNKPFYACSKPFYTHPQGYKVCLAVHANGMEEGKSVSVIVFLMQGVFDDELAWPFRGKITIYLLNQFEDRQHQEITIKSQLNGDRVTEGKKSAIGIGNLTYISDMDTRYLKHNRLCFQIANIELKDAVAVVPTDVVMTNFEGHRQNSEQWYSEPFYTHPGGYKMCLNVHANGAEGAKGTHVSVFIHLMQRERGDQPKGPFHAEITIQLLNQLSDGGHWAETIDVDDGSLHARRVLWQGRCFPLSIHSKGKDEFIAHTQLSTQDVEYLTNDCLKFRISKVVIKST